ncbi:MAG: AAA family ATPase [Phycisphaeraceae bacterium]|nr:AAA family ATPase [Phycisphaeraceae bacterium]
MNESDPITPGIPNKPTNALIDRSRVRGASRMIAQGTDPKDVTSEQIERVAADVDSFCRANKITRQAIAKAVGYSPSVIVEFLKGTYAGKAGEVAIHLEEWLIEEEQRRANAQETQYVWTNVARYIEAIAGYCLDMKKVGLIYGPKTSGIGKTTALRAIAQEMGPRRATLITVDKCDANPTGLLRKILGGLRLNESGSNAQRMQRVIDHLNGRSHLLLIDQIHNLRFAKEDRPFYYLMDIYEATEHSAQLWCGTSDLVAYLTRQQKTMMDEPLAQVRRRIFPCVDLMEVFNQQGGGEPLYTVEQIREMFASFKLKLTPTAARWLCALGHQDDAGGLGICVQIMEYAVYLAKTRKLTTVDVPLLKEAIQSGLTTDRASKLIVDIERPDDRMTKVA